MFVFRFSSFHCIQRAIFVGCWYFVEIHCWVGGMPEYFLCHSYKLFAHVCIGFRCALCWIKIENAQCVSFDLCWLWINSYSVWIEKHLFEKLFKIRDIQCAKYYQSCGVSLCVDFLSKKKHTNKTFDDGDDVFDTWRKGTVEHRMIHIDKLTTWQNTMYVRTFLNIYKPENAYIEQIMMIEFQDKVKVL